MPYRQVLSFLLFFILKNVDFKQNMGFKGSFNRNYLRMKNSIRILFVILLLTSCKKDSIPPENLVSTITWEFTQISEYADSGEFGDIIEYYNEDNLITSKENFLSTDEIRVSSYTYNNDGELKIYEGEGWYIEYYYENGLRMKKVAYDNSLKSLQYYQEYEYSNSKLIFKYHFSRDSFLVSTAKNFYTSNILDSTYHYFANDVDSIEGKVIYQYDDNNNLLEESGWKWSVENQQFYLVSKSYYEYENNRLTISETRTDDNELFGFIKKYFYDSEGRKNKIEIYYEDILLGYYDISYSSNNSDFVVPAL